MHPQPYILYCAIHGNVTKSVANTMQTFLEALKSLRLIILPCTSSSFLKAIKLRNIFFSSQNPSSLFSLAPFHRYISFSVDKKFQVESLTNQEEVELRAKIEALGLEVTKVPSKSARNLNEVIQGSIQPFQDSFEACLVFNTHKKKRVIGKACLACSIT